MPFFDPLSPICSPAIPPLSPYALLPVPCPRCSFPPPLDQGEQTKLLIISVLQPLFCALIKGAASGLCVSGPYRRSRWANANITCLIIYVCETQRPGGGVCVRMGGGGVFITGTDALKRTCFQDNGPGA